MKKRDIHHQSGLSFEILSVTLHVTHFDSNSCLFPLTKPHFSESTTANFWVCSQKNNKFRLWLHILTQNKKLPFSNTSSDSGIVSFWIVVLYHTKTNEWFNMISKRYGIWEKIENQMKLYFGIAWYFWVVGCGGFWSWTSFWSSLWLCFLRRRRDRKRIKKITPPITIAPPTDTTTAVTTVVVSEDVEGVVSGAKRKDHLDIWIVVEGYNIEVWGTFNNTDERNFIENEKKVKVKRWYTLRCYWSGGRIEYPRFCS